MSVTGPDAGRLLEHPAVAKLAHDDAAFVIYSCSRTPTDVDVAAVQRLAADHTVVLDSSDAAWLTRLPAGVDWIKLHAWREEVFAEVVDDDVAGVTPGEAVPALLAALGASSVRVPALPGLVADRLANCMANEAYAVMEEGTAGPDDINVALRLAMNHPVGPLEYVDRVGADAVHDVL